jgi:hypothetical protein
VTDYPLVPIVRTLVSIDATPEALAYAASCAGSEEIAFAREILDQQLSSAEVRLLEIDERLSDLRYGVGL